ncbi:hypothetical protein FACS1894172_01580 [Spirochaetia bacterium]|nr:hypothetical protein FACS1894164_04600 [Spirochaetia bacterium]GHU29761.1 hypothetical protein FACS1894172_01580 [Spirochaetia bacterium]
MHTTARPVKRKYIVFIIALIAVVGAVVLMVRTMKRRVNYTQEELQSLWDNASYYDVFTKSGILLETYPLDPYLLTLRGFSAYQLAIAQINSSDMLTFIDSSIWSLRKALLIKNDNAAEYVLGKAYYYKGQSFADLAVKFLEQASSGGSNAPDIPEFLGILYAQLRDFKKSTAAFSQSLNITRNAEYSSDRVLLSIARSYLELEEWDSAQNYLNRCIDISKDSNAISRAHFLLGTIFEKTGDAARASGHFLAAIEIGGENADAHYHLGEVYAAQDIAKARAEWRRALQIDPGHQQARERIN